MLSTLLSQFTVCLTFTSCGNNISTQLCKQITREVVCSKTTLVKRWTEIKSWQSGQTGNVNQRLALCCCLMTRLKKRVSAVAAKFVTQPRWLFISSTRLPLLIKTFCMCNCASCVAKWKCVSCKEPSVYAGRLQPPRTERKAGAVYLCSDAPCPTLSLCQGGRRLTGEQGETLLRQHWCLAAFLVWEATKPRWKTSQVKKKLQRMSLNYWKKYLPVNIHMYLLVNDSDDSVLVSCT